MAGRGVHTARGGGGEGHYFVKTRVGKGKKEEDGMGWLFFALRPGPGTPTRSAGLCAKERGIQQRGLFPFPEGRRWLAVCTTAVRFGL